MTGNDPDGTSAAAGGECGDCGVVELRRYTLRPGRRDTLITLFEREFIEPQEAVGMRLLGQFRDLDVPDRFVWLRGFADMASRRRALQAFYGGPVWAAHRDAANATMIDSDDVLLLRPAWRGAASALQSNGRAPAAADRVPEGLIALTIFPLREPADADVVGACRDRVATALRESGALRQAWFTTEPGANDFPRLPVREGEPVLVGLAVFADDATFDRFRLGRRWAGDIVPALSPWLIRPAELHRLQPTPRSALHAGGLS